MSDVAQVAAEQPRSDSPDPLRCTTPMALRAPAPVIVIGLPRSGSTFLTHVLNCTADWFIFDDLYCLQKAESLGCDGPLSREQIERLVHFLGWQARARIRHNTDFEQLPMTWADVDALCETLLAVCAGREMTWPQVMNEYLTRVAAVCGKRRWGYKTPQDFQHIERLRRIFPQARFIFILRDPRRMMASYKFNRTKDGHPGQYHPWVYARYWKMAVAEAGAECWRVGVPMLVVRFEDLVSEPDEAAERIVGFVGSTLARPISRSRSNTSFGRSGRRSITPTEAWICHRVCGKLMIEQGYAPGAVRPRVIDLPDLLATTFRFFAYQTVRVLRDPVARVKVRGFLKRLTSRRPR